MKNKIRKLFHYLSRFEVLLLGLLEKLICGLIKKLTGFSCALSQTIDRITTACNEFLDNCKALTTK
jgi:hypothetical protein